MIFMYLMYVDESGDTGLTNSPTRYFVLTGLVVHELRWHVYLDQLITFRQYLRTRFGLKLREEFHTAALITKPGPLSRMPKNDRLAMIRQFAAVIGGMTEVSLLNVVVDKKDKPDGYDVFQMAWKSLIQRFENTLTYGNFPGPKNSDDRGLLLCDHTQDKKLRTLLRKMRRYNPVPHSVASGRSGFRDLPILALVEDPNFRDSLHSFYVQAVDMAAYLLSQRLVPNAYMRKKGGQNYWKRLEPICCRYIAPRDPEGIVRL